MIRKRWEGRGEESERMETPGAQGDWEVLCRLRILNLCLILRH